MAPSYWKIDEEAEENQAMVGQQGGEVDTGMMGSQVRGQDQAQCL